MKFSIRRLSAALPIATALAMALPTAFAVAGVNPVAPAGGREGLRTGFGDLCTHYSDTSGTIQLTPCVRNDTTGEFVMDFTNAPKLRFKDALNRCISGDAWGGVSLATCSSSRTDQLWNPERKDLVNSTGFRLRNVSNLRYLNNDSGVMNSTSYTGSTAEWYWSRTSQPAVVSVGDSYISGEAGRWAGNTTAYSYLQVDGLGSTAYNDSPLAEYERINRCHRSQAAMVHIGGGVASINLACSGSKTRTFMSSDGYFKPGIDFDDWGNGQIGQALALERLARTRNIKMVDLSIGGNDFNFGDIVQTCLKDFMLSSSSSKKLCQSEASVASNFTQTNLTNQKWSIRDAITRVEAAMWNAGYQPSEWTLMVNTYPVPLATPTANRYPETGFTRQTVGGCGIWNADTTWAIGTALPTINRTVTDAVQSSGLTNVKILDMSQALKGHELCNQAVNLYENSGLTSSTSLAAAPKLEWVDQIKTVETAVGPYLVQEGLHPNYFGQLAMRNCVRQAYNGGSPRSGKCQVLSDNVNPNGEPYMTLAP